MPDLWLPSAQRIALPDTAPTDGGPAKAIAHITWDRNASAAKPQDLIPYETLRRYFAESGAFSAPHFLWDPFTGRVTQYYPATSRSKSVRDLAGGTRTNRAGRVVIQIEALFFPYCRVGGKTYARLVDTPMKGWAELNAFTRSWGVPDVWPMGRPTDFTPHRDPAVWTARGGWYAHAHVPENDHQDPGSWPAFTTTEDDMTPDQAKQLAELHKVLYPYAGWGYTGKDVKGDAYAHLLSGASSAASAHTKVTAVAAKTDALSVKVDALAAKVDGIVTTGLTPEQITAIANAVADVQAARLAD